MVQGSVERGALITPFAVCFCMTLSSLVVLERTHLAFSASDSLGLRELSNQAINSAALDNDPVMAEVAVIAYALSKLLAKAHFQKESSWPALVSSVKKDLVAAIVFAKKQDWKKTTQLLKNITSTISKTDARFGNFWQNGVEKARVKLASSAYALGLSLSQAHMLTGCDKSELFNYIGFTKMHEETPVSKSIVVRVKELDGLIQGNSK